MNLALPRFAALLLFCTASVAQNRLAIVPERPVAGEPFVIEHTGDGRRALNYLRQRSTVTVEGSDITFALDFTGPGIGSPKFPDLPDLVMRTYLAQQMAVVPGAGTYRLSRSIDGVRDSLATIAVDPPRPAAAPQWTNLSGNYFAPDENGAGVNVVQAASGQMFVAWFTYASLEFQALVPGYPSSWYVVTGGKWISPTEFLGVMHDAYGTPFERTYDAARFTARPVGVMSLKFADRNVVDLDAQFTSGIRKQKRLGRQQF
jgi:hypothetical protein